MRVPTKVLLSCWLIIFLCAAASAQNLGYYKQAAKLVASDGASGDEFGVQISVDGNTLAVAAPGENSGVGAVYIFVKSNDGATQVAKLTASDGVAQENFGSSVSISGNTIVIGSADHSVGSNQSQGAAYVFVEPPSGWANMTQTAELTASDGAANDLFGSGIAIRGNTLVVGAPGATVGSNSEQGAAYVFVEPAGGWQNMLQTAKLTASNGAAQNALGASVSISSNALVAAAPGGNDGHGAAYVFVEPEGGWANMTQTAELTASAHAAFQAIALSGNTVVAGAPYTPGFGTQTGEALVYVRPSNGWKSTSTPNAVLTASNAVDGDELGLSVSVNRNVVAAGAPNAAGTGAAYVFVEPLSGWANMTETSEVTPSGGKSGDFFGRSVANLETTVLAGSPLNEGEGAVYAFVYVSR